MIITRQYSTESSISVKEMRKGISSQWRVNDTVEASYTTVYNKAHPQLASEISSLLDAKKWKLKRNSFYIYLYVMPGTNYYDTPWLDLQSHP